MKSYLVQNNKKLSSPTKEQFLFSFIVTTELGCLNLNKLGNFTFKIGKTYIHISFLCDKKINLNQENIHRMRAHKIFGASLKLYF